MPGHFTRPKKLHCFNRSSFIHHTTGLVLCKVVFLPKQAELVYTQFPWYVLKHARVHVHAKPADLLILIPENTVTNTSGVFGQQNIFLYPVVFFLI